MRFFTVQSSAILPTYLIHSATSFEEPMNALLQLAYRQRYQYADFHTFFTAFIHLIDLGSYKLSFSEFIFYCQQIAQTQRQSHIDWCTGSLVSIKRCLFRLSDNDLIRLADYFLSKPYIEIMAVLKQQRSQAATEEMQMLASEMFSIVHTFIALLMKQLESSGLSAERKALSDILSSHSATIGDVELMLMQITVLQLLNSLILEELRGKALEHCLDGKVAEL